MLIDNDLEETCVLNPSGKNHNLPGVERWVAARVAHLTSEECLAPFKASVWPYRMGDHILISCDIDGRHSGVSITFKVGGEHDFDETEPTVPDAAEAIHMIGMLTRRIGAKVTLGR